MSESLVIADLTFRCAICGDVLMRDGGYRHEVGQEHFIGLCIKNDCLQFGRRLKIPLQYLKVSDE